MQTCLWPCPLMSSAAPAQLPQLVRVVLECDLHHRSWTGSSVQAGLAQMHGTNGVPFVLAPFPQCEPPNFQFHVANQEEKEVDRSEPSYHGAAIMDASHSAVHAGVADLQQSSSISPSTFPATQSSASSPSRFTLRSYRDTHISHHKQQIRQQSCRRRGWQFR